MRKAREGTRQSHADGRRVRPVVARRWWWPRFTYILPNMTNIRRTLIGVAAAASLAATAHAQTFELTIPPGNNFDKANFRMWVPANPGTLRGAVVLVPGSNGDGRSMVTDTLWQSFATKHHFALVGCQFTDKPHDQGFIEDYVNVSQGSGQALLDALTALGKASQHQELATAPFFLWGMSAGG